MSSAQADRRARTINFSRVTLRSGAERTIDVLERDDSPPVVAVHVTSNSGSGRALRVLFFEHDQPALARAIQVAKDPHWDGRRFNVGAISLGELKLQLWAFRNERGRGVGFRRQRPGGEWIGQSTYITDAELDALDGAVFHAAERRTQRDES